MLHKKPKHKKLNPLEREFVSNKIRHLMKKEGKTHKEAVGQALGMSRQSRSKKHA